MDYSAIVCLLTTVLTAITAPLVSPKHQQLRSPGSGVVHCTFPTPLVGCRFRVSEHLHEAFDHAAVDFDLGARSGNVVLDLGVNASYAGEGLAQGHCGLELKMDGVYLTLLVQCFGKTSDGRWGRGFGLVDVSASTSLASNTSTPRLVTAVHGQDVDVTLSTHGELESCYLWTPAEGDAEWTPGVRLPSDGRYRLHEADVGPGQCVATLSAVTHRDAGVWMLRGYRERLRAAAAQSAVLLVEAAPVGEPLLTVSDSSPARVGSVLNARCVAPPGVPAANLTWLLDGRVVREDDLNDTLAADLAKSWPWDGQATVQTFTRVLKEEDAGKRLECRMDHSALSSHKSVGIEIKVFDVFPANPVVRSAAGHRSELVCHVIAPTNATVQWRRDDVPVQVSPLVVVGDNGTRHWLVLEDTGDDDFGSFTCTASFGNTSLSEVVQLTGLPGTPQWANITAQSQLTWRVESVASITGSLLKVRRGTDKWQQLSGHTSSEERPGWHLVRFDWLPLTPGQHSFYVKVRNAHGWSPVSAIQNVEMTSPLPNVTTRIAADDEVGCPALSLVTLDASCWVEGHSVDCPVGRVPLGTSVRLQCREGYRAEDDGPDAVDTSCSVNGWSHRSFVCKLDCGLRRGGAEELSVGGQEAQASEFPWHVAVFRKNLDRFQPICGGSLITTSFFVSAGHCFWNEKERKVRNASLYWVALGKHTLGWETRDPHEQRRAVQQIHMPKYFGGGSKHLESDIAVVQLKSSVQVTWAVNVVCVDWGKPFEQQQLVNLSVGTVPGWGSTENDTMSPTLRFIDLPFVPYEDCQASVPLGFQDYLLRDKICGGFHNRSIGLCRGDSGGGFVFPAESFGSRRRYFLRGVTSSSPTRPWGQGSRMKCYPEHRSAFTRVSMFVDWLHEIVKHTL